MHHAQIVTKRSKQIFIETLREIYWLLETGFTKFEILILVLTSLLLKLGPKFAYLVRKVIKGLKRSKKKPNWHISLTIIDISIFGSRSLSFNATIVAHNCQVSACLHSTARKCNSLWKIHIIERVKYLQHSRMAKLSKIRKVI